MQLRYSIALDVLLTFVSVVIGLILRLDSLIAITRLIDIAPFVILAMFVRPAILYFARSYWRIWRYASIREFIEFAAYIVLGSAVLILAVNVWLVPAELVHSFPRSLLILEGLTSLLLLGGVRVLLKLINPYSPRERHRTAADGKESKRVLIVGAGETGAMIVKEFSADPAAARVLVGLLDDDPKKIGRNLMRVPVLGPVSTLPEVIRREQIDEVILAMPSALRRIAAPFRVYLSRAPCRPSQHPSAFPTSGSNG